MFSQIGFKQEPETMCCGVFVPPKQHQFNTQRSPKSTTQVYCKCFNKLSLCRVYQASADSRLHRQEHGCATGSPVTRVSNDIEAVTTLNSLLKS